MGDAAYVMKPTHAAGAGIVIESAASLEVLFCRVDSSDDQAMRQRLQMSQRKLILFNCLGSPFSGLLALPPCLLPWVIIQHRLAHVLHWRPLERRVRLDYVNTLDYVNPKNYPAPLNCVPLNCVARP